LVPSSAVDSYRTFANTAEGRKHIINGFNTTFVFSGLYEDNYIQAYRHVNLGSNSKGQLRYTASRRLRADLNVSSQHFEIAENENSLLSALSGFLEAVGDNQSVTYDLSEIGVNRASFFTSLYADSFQWDVGGPLSGVLPSFTLPTAAAETIEAGVLSFAVIGSDGYMQSGGLE
ncbi:hypothetical protein, partial [Halorubrum tibetense]